MNTTNFLLKLIDVELNLLICRAKLALCSEESDIDSAGEAIQIAMDCGSQFESLNVSFYSSCCSDLAFELISSIRHLYCFLPNALKSGFDTGRCDVCIGRMEDQGEYINIISESNWIIQDDCKTEIKQLIGFNGIHYFFGYVEGWTTSVPSWDRTPFASIEEAKRGRYEAEKQIEQQQLEDLRPLNEYQCKEIKSIPF